MQLETRQVLNQEEESNQIASMDIIASSRALDDLIRYPTLVGGVRSLSMTRSGAVFASGVAMRGALLRREPSMPRGASPGLASPHRAILYKHRQRGRESAEPSALESFDYEEHNSLVTQNFDRALSDTDRRREVCLRWTLSLFVALATALLALAIRGLTGLIFNYKAQLLHRALSHGWSAGLRILLFAGINGVLVCGAAALVAVLEPVAAGSGIPEIKCTLMDSSFLES